jgi:hypothetical protein
VALALVAAAVLGAGCSVRRIENGVFHSAKGYRVAIPGSAWAVVESSDADLELRHRVAPAGILAHAECGSPLAGRPASALERNLFLGLRERTVVDRGEVTLAGRAATRVVLDAAPAAAADLVRIEAWTMSDGRCVYDLLYAAPPQRFVDVLAAFEGFVASFALETR